MKKTTEEKLPELSQLMEGAVVLSAKCDYNRHLRAAAIHPVLTLQLRLVTLDEPGDGDEWAAFRKTLGVGQVRCALCEIDGDGDSAGCPMCKGIGMIPRKTWDSWYYSEKGCASYKAGCEAKCAEQHCPHDASRSVVSAAVLVLEALKPGGKWKLCGNSLDGFKVDDLCKNPPALLRFLNLVIDTTGVAADFGEED